MVQNNSPYRLYGPSESVQIRKCVAVANVAKVDFGHSHSKPGDDLKSTFAIVSPLNVYPALSTPCGNIVGSNAICAFLANCAPAQKLSGCDVFQAGMIQGTVETCSNVLEVALYKKTELGLDATPELTKYFDELEKKLTLKTYLVGEQKSYADIAVAIVVKSAEKASVKLGPAVTRWLNTIFSDPRVAKAMNTKASVAGSSPRKGKKADKAPAAEAAPEPAAPASAAFDMGLPCLVAMDISEFEHIKAPADLEKVSPEGINLEGWKRDYSNSHSDEEYKAAFEKFKAAFNPEEYTIWKMTYDKVEGECEKDYLTSNLLNGFLQRMDPKARSQGFGVCNVLGEEPSFNYEGVFIFRGTEMPFFMVDHPSFEYHKFAKLDHTNEEHMNFVFDFWCAEETILGKKIQDCKQFK